VAIGTKIAAMSNTASRQTGNDQRWDFYWKVPGKEIPDVGVCIAQGACRPTPARRSPAMDDPSGHEFGPGVLPTLPVIQFRCW
jgi:hypothetical protein